MQFTKSKTLDSITAQFNKVIVDLNDLITSNVVKRTNNESAIVDLTAQNQVLKAETERAEKIKANIEKLIG